MIKEYKDEYFNRVLVLGREIKDDYELSFSPVSKCFIYEEDLDSYEDIKIDEEIKRLEIN